jgi:hypothetical protein
MTAVTAAQLSFPRSRTPIMLTVIVVHRVTTDDCQSLVHFEFVPLMEHQRIWRLS